MLRPLELDTWPCGNVENHGWNKRQIGKKMVENHGKNGGNIGKHRGNMVENHGKIYGGHIGKNYGKMVENQTRRLGI